MTRDLDNLVRDAAPIDDEQVRDLWSSGLADELVSAILADGQRQHPRPARAGRSRRRGWSFAGVAALATATIVIVLSFGDSPRTERAWAAPALRVANALPRFLVGEQGWSVRRADQFMVGEAEMTFGNGTSSVDLHWRSEGAIRMWLGDRAASADRVATVEVLGERAHVFRYRRSRDDYTALWRSRRYTMELRSGIGGLDRQRFLGVLASLRVASVDEWLSAMPASVVKPVDQQRVIAEMLADIPQPTGFAIDPSDSSGVVRDRYQLGARVAGAVACAWIEQWVRARRAADERAARQAVDAMATSRRWAILREMQKSGAYPDVLWNHADAMAGSGKTYGGRGIAVEDSYKSALGCAQMP